MLYLDVSFTFFDVLYVGSQQERLLERERERERGGGEGERERAKRERVRESERE